MIGSRWKLVTSSMATRLHDMSTDPLEMLDESKAHSATVGRLRDHLIHSTFQPRSVPAEVAPRIRAELEALGYSEHGVDPTGP